MFGEVEKKEERFGDGERDGCERRARARRTVNSARRSKNMSPAAASVRVGSLFLLLLKSYFAPVLNGPKKAPGPPTNFQQKKKKTKIIIITTIKYIDTYIFKKKEI